MNYNDRALQIVDAEQVAEYSKMLFYGTPHSGKSYTSLQVANEMKVEGDQIGVIDLEGGGTTQYSRKFPHRLIKTPSAHPNYIIDAVDIFLKEQIDIIVVDGLDELWSWAIQYADEKGSWSQISKMTNKALDYIARVDAHIIATSKTTNKKRETKSGDAVDAKPAPPQFGKRYLEATFHLAIALSTAPEKSIEFYWAKSRYGDTQGDCQVVSYRDTGIIARKIATIKKLVSMQEYEKPLGTMRKEALEVFDELARIDKKAAENSEVMYEKIENATRANAARYKKIFEKRLQEANEEREYAKEQELAKKKRARRSVEKKSVKKEAPQEAPQETLKETPNEVVAPTILSKKRFIKHLLELRLSGEKSRLRNDLLQVNTNTTSLLSLVEYCVDAGIPINEEWLDVNKEVSKWK